MPIGGPTGGGQAGFGSGGSFTGANEALEIIGNHAYAYNSATVGAETLTAFSFTSGNFYYDGKVYFNFNSTGFTSGERIGYQVTLNGTLIVNAVYGDNVQSPSGNPQETRILIPPYSEVLISWVNSDTTGIGCTMGMVGEIFRA